MNNQLIGLIFMANGLLCAALFGFWGVRTNRKFTLVLGAVSGLMFLLLGVAIFLGYYL